MNDVKSQSKPENATKQQTGGDWVRRLVRWFDFVRSVSRIVWDSVNYGKENIYPEEARIRDEAVIKYRREQRAKGVKPLNQTPYMDTQG